jgi:hypothetical protein
MKITVLASAIALAVTAPAAATMIFDGSILSRGASSFFGANAGAFGRYTVASTTTISSFLTLDALGTAANLTFRIYDSTTGALLFTSAAKAFAADASATVAEGTLKKERPAVVYLRSGHDLRSRCGDRQRFYAADRVVRDQDRGRRFRFAGQSERLRRCFRYGQGLLQHCRPVLHR